MLRLPKVLQNTNEGDRVAGVIEELRLQDSESLRLVLVGMGGIGKTTLAKQVVLKISCHFEFVCFVEDAQQKLASAHLRTLIAENLYKGVGTKVDLRAGEDVWMLMRGKKLLIVVDNLDNGDEIVDLSESSWTENGSRLIITSRNHRVLKGAIIHEVPFLSKVESQALFEAHMVNRRPVVVPKDLAEQIVERCDGLPLALVVIGSYLSEEEEVSSWIDALSRLEEAQTFDGNGDDKLWKKLRVSYDKLGKIEQEMFLDITAFDMFGSKLTHYGVDVLEVALKTSSDGMSSHVTLRNLEKRSFVRLMYSAEHGRPTIGLNGREGYTIVVSIHQQLRDLGKSMNRPVNQAPKLCRGLWNINDASFLWEKYKGECAASTQVLSLHVDIKKESASSSSSVQNTHLHLSSKSLANLERLRLLRTSNIIMKDSNRCSRFPGSLVMLHMINSSKAWRLKPDWQENKCWPIREGDVQGLHQLRVLLIHNCNPVRFPSNFHELRNLKVQVADKALKRLPKKIGLLPALEQISIEIAGLEELPASLFRSTSLQAMTIQNCSSLRTLPELRAAPNVSEYRYSLTHLRLVGLPGLEKLPESLVEMKFLQSLEIESCKALVELPENFGDLLQLRELQRRSCPSIRALPESFGQLPRLKSLTLSDRESYQNLGHLLFSLFVRGDPEIGGLPESKFSPSTFDRLPSLEWLNIVDCPALRTFPENFRSLQNALWFEGCDGSLVRSVMEQGRGSPGSVRANDVMSSCDGAVSGSQSPTTWQEDGVHHLDTHRPLHVLGPPGRCEKLTSIRLWGMDDLKYIPESIGRYRSVRHIMILSCEDLEGLPESLGQLTELRTLMVGHCGKVKGLPDSLGDAINLERLNVRYCATFEHVPMSLGKLLKLRSLKIVFCECFRGLPDGLREILGSRSCEIIIK